MKTFKKVKIHCLKCNDTLEFDFESPDSPCVGRVIYCKCKAVGVDAKPIMYRILGDPADYEDLSEEFPFDWMLLRRRSY